ncbi:MAG: GNAT family N-acetyltransferase [Spirochaetota bacterium]|nr:GNAT family N-acetyltransferase [Spirochaetota bacterium]
MSKDQESIKIRKMTEADFAAIIELDKKVSGKERSTTWPQKVTSHLRTYSPAMCHIAEVDGEVVGFILGDMRGSEVALPLSCWVDIVGIDPEYQRMGIGTKLIDAFENECKRNHVKMRLIINENDEDVIKFLSSMGFHRGKLVNYER